MANIDIEMSEFANQTTLANSDYLVVSLENGTQGKIKVSDLASVVAAVLSITQIKLSLDRQFTTYGLFYLSPNQSKTFEAKGFVYVYNSYQSNGWYVLWVDEGGVSVIRQLGAILPFSASYSDGKFTITNNQSNNRGYVLACQNLEIVETS